MKQAWNNRIKKQLHRTLAAVFAACLLMISVEWPVLAANGGSCGANLKWSLSVDGELAIAGKGAMTNYYEGAMAPWYSSREKITSITIKEGVTNVGNLAFYGCSSIQSITLPSTITKIGDMAFAGCTSLARVKLNDGLKSIGANAFARCESLGAIRLPNGLLNIGYQAFYLCTSLSSIRIPKTTTNLSESIFAYCSNLTQAIIESPIGKLPEWTFYGCTSLTEISLPSAMQNIGEYAFHDCESLEKTYHDGSEGERKELTTQIQNQLPNFEGVIEGDHTDVGASKTETTTKNEDGSVVETEKEVVDTGSATIDTTVNHTKPVDGKNEYDVVIDVTIDDKQGWDDMLDHTDDYIRYPERLEGADAAVNKVEINVNLNGSTELPSHVLEGLAGHKVNMTVSTGTNSKWTIDCENIDTEDLAKSYNLQFTLRKNTKPTKAQKKLIGYSQSFYLEFDENIPFEVTVQVPLGYSYAKHFASICQKPVLKGWEIMQSVVIDQRGTAMFYLGALDKHTDYLIAIDIQGISLENAIIPESMKDQFGTLSDESGNKYVLTGTRSAWGITFGQLTLIIIGVIVISGVVVGVVVKMYFKMSMNRNTKRRK